MGIARAMLRKPTVRARSTAVVPAGMMVAALRMKARPTRVGMRTAMIDQILERVCCMGLFPLSCLLYYK